MKKIFLLLILWLSVHTEFTFAGDPVMGPMKPFCLNNEIHREIAIADVWVIPTPDIEGSQLLGQFNRVTKELLENVTFTENEVDVFTSAYPDFIRKGEANFFLTRQGKNFSFITVTRKGDSITRNPTQESAKKLVPQVEGDFIFIFIRKKDNQS
jgi:hypothetical protein